MSNTLCPTCKGTYEHHLEVPSAKHGVCPEFFTGQVPSPEQIYDVRHHLKDGGTLAVIPLLEPAKPTDTSTDNFKDDCPTCEGIGTITRFYVVPCPTCGGTGQKLTPDQPQAPKTINLTGYLTKVTKGRPSTADTTDEAEADQPQADDWKAEYKWIEAIPGAYVDYKLPSRIPDVTIDAVDFKAAFEKCHEIDGRDVHYGDPHDHFSNGDDAKLAAEAVGEIWPAIKVEPQADEPNKKIKRILRSYEVDQALVDGDTLININFLAADLSTLIAQAKIEVLESVQNHASKNAYGYPPEPIQVEMSVIDDFIDQAIATIKEQL